MPTTVEMLLRDAAAHPGDTKPLVVLVLHALPNRNCQSRGAATSAICCHYVPLGGGATACDHSPNGGGGACEVGLDEYRTDVVDALAALLHEHQAQVPVALILEPSYASLALGTSAPKCTDAVTQHAYAAGVEYAVQQLSSRAPRVALYLAAADGRQLGWGARVRSYVTQVSRLGPLAFKLRGFATNIGRYQPLGQLCPVTSGETLSAYCAKHSRDPCCGDRCGLIERFNSGVGELNYVHFLAKHLKTAMPGLKPRFVIDTARNGVPARGAGCDATCNARAAGLGPRPTSQTALPELVDAYYWLQPPGISGGCADCGAHSDPACARSEALGTGVREPQAPPAGDFSPAFFRQLATQSVLANNDPASASIVVALRHAESQVAEFAQAAGVTLPNDSALVGFGWLGSVWPTSALGSLVVALCGLVLVVLLRFGHARQQIVIDTPFDDEEADGDDIPGGGTRKQSRKGNKSGKRASRKTRAGDGGEEGDIDNDGHQAACMEVMAPSSPVAPARASHSSSTSTTDSTSYVMVD
jgi:hypothetical protein